jgi:alpha-mannosidase/mannosylglycerate hydrolase
MMDFLLALLETDPNYRHFYLDGQTVVLEDYLEIRPENRERIHRLFDAGRLYVGPWYIQPDEFLVSGEATIRNLLLGKRQCAEWGAFSRIGYAPDAFGHISQTPQILRGFGIDNAVLFRGITTDQADSEFLWRSPDGSEVLCIKMPDDTAYSNFYYHFRKTFQETPGSEGPHLPAPNAGELNREQVLQEAASLYAESLAQRPNTSVLLWMDGVDHIFPQPRTPQIIALVNEAMGAEVQVMHSTLPAFLAAVREANPELKTITGELRHTNRRWRLQALLADVASSRIHLKQKNHACEILLERYAEPFAALAARFGLVYPGAFLAHAWKQLLLNQPHDSICGCSIDQVHVDMLSRYDQCRLIGEKIVRDSLAYLAAQIDTSAPVGTHTAEGEPIQTLMPEPLCALAVFNPLAWPRTEMVEMMIELPSRLAPADGNIAVRGPNGEAIPCTVYPIKDYHTLNQARFDIPVGEMHKRWQVRFLAAVPAFGYQTYTITPELCPDLPVGVQADEFCIENAFLKVEWAEDQTITLTDKTTGRVYLGGFVLEDGGDFGDGYNYAQPQNDTVFLGKAEACDTLIEGQQARMELQFLLELPVDRADAALSEETEPLFVFAELSLDQNARSLRVEIHCHNEGLLNHRLRLLFPTGLAQATHSHAEQAFDVVARPIAVPDGKGWREPPHGRCPMKAFVDVSDGEFGLAILTNGLPQYEVLDDPERTIALTLLRATGRGVGTPEQQEQGQMQGAHLFHLAICPHAGDWEQARLWQEAHNFNVPLRAAQTTCHAGALPRTHSFFQVSAETLVPTTLKRSEDAEGIIFRAFNIGSEPLTDAAVTPSPLLQLGTPERVRLDEEPEPEASAILPPKRIATWKF